MRVLQYLALGVVSVVLYACLCGGSDAFRSESGMVFNGRAISGRGVGVITSLYPDLRISVTRNTVLTNMLHIGDERLVRAGIPDDYAESVKRTIITTNFLQVHDISVVPSTNIKQPIHTIQKTNSLFPVYENVSYTLVCDAERSGRSLVLQESEFNTRWEKTAHALHPMIQRFMRRVYGRVVSVFIKDMETGNTISYNPDIRLFGSSMLKTYVMAAIFSRFEIDDRTITTNAALLAEDPGRPDAAELRSVNARLASERRLYESFMFPMVVTSINPQYAYFRQTYGDDYFADFLASTGFFPRTTLRTGDRLTTARDLARLFELYYHGEFFHDPYLQWRPLNLLSQAGRYGAAFYLPSYVEFAQKRGLRWHFNYQARHISGILYFKDRPVIISVTSASPFFDEDSMELVTRLSSRIGRLIYHECFHHLYSK